MTTVKNVTRVQWATVWLAAIVVLFVGSVAAGGPTSGSARALWLLAGLAPPAVMLLVWRAPARTVAEVLYAVNQPDKDGRS